jgi:hypothetical protein
VQIFAQKHALVRRRSSSNTRPITETSPRRKRYTQDLDPQPAATGLTSSRYVSQAGEVAFSAPRTRNGPARLGWAWPGSLRFVRRPPGNSNYQEAGAKPFSASPSGTPLSSASTVAFRVRSSPLNGRRAAAEVQLGHGREQDAGSIRPSDLEIAQG